MKKVTIHKCSCGCCDDWWLNVGKFVQGSGFDKKTAERIARAVNSHDALRHVANLLATAFEEFEDIDNMDAADFKDRAAITWGAVEAARVALDMEEKR